MGSSLVAVTYRNKIKTNFQGKKMPQENTSCKCLSLIMLDCVIRVNKKYYPQIILKECKYKIKNTKTEDLNNDDLDASSSNESDNKYDSESDNVNDNKSNKESID